MVANTTRMAKSTGETPNFEDTDCVWEEFVEPIEGGENVPLRTPSPTSYMPPTARSPPRKRKPRYRAAHNATLPHKLATPLLVNQQRPPRNKFATGEIVDGVINGTSFVALYMFDVTSTAISLLRRPLYFIIFLWMLAMIIGFISHTLWRAVAPLCYLPGLSGSSLCRPPDFVGGGGGQPRWADYPTLINVQSTTFEHLLDESVGGSGLALEIKKAQLATTDLVALVRISNLHSRDTLGDFLQEFVDDARKTSRSLQKLGSKIGGAVDDIMAVNDYALHTIEAAHANAPSSFSIQGLIPWVAPRPTNEIVTQTFGEAMSFLAKVTERLILEAGVNIANLDRLEERLSTIHDIVSGEDQKVSLGKDRLEGKLWTILGGNKEDLRQFNKHLMLLKNLGTYRKKALVHVVAALQTLEGMNADMEVIRERVAAPELTGSKIPVEVHIKSIRAGLERLKEVKVRARKVERQAM